MEYHTFCTQKCPDSATYRALILYLQRATFPYDRSCSFLIRPNPSSSVLIRVQYLIHEISMNPRIRGQLRMERHHQNTFVPRHHNLLAVTTQYFRFFAHRQYLRRTDEHALECRFPVENVDGHDIREGIHLPAVSIPCQARGNTTRMNAWS